jgi:peptide chain release factor 2
MFIDELRENLKSVEPELEAIKEFYKNNEIESQYNELEKQINDENFWQNPDRIKISKEHQRIKLLHEQYNKLIKNYSENLELLELFQEGDAELKNLKSEVLSLCKQIKKFKIELLLNKPEDSSNCFLSINAQKMESIDLSEFLHSMQVNVDTHHLRPYL